MENEEISFGPFRLHFSRRELRRDETLIRLHRRALDMLCALAAAKGEVVGKEELMTQLWPGRIVEGGNLHVHVSALRRALDEHGGGHSYIVTVPGRGYRLAGLAGRTSERLTQPSHPQALSLPDKPSIAVLAFTNLSGDPEQEAFADGIAEDIITGLARYPSLFVIARNSSFAYKGRAVDAKQVGRELGVRYILEGSLRKSGHRIRVTAQLVEAETGTHVWAERYDSDFADIFLVQDNITRAATIAIAPVIASAERQRAMRIPPGKLDAWAAYQRGLWHFCKANQEENAVAQRYFQQSVDIDPNFAGGYKGLAWTHIHAVGVFAVASPNEAYTLTASLARRAIALDPTDAEARAILSETMLWSRGDYEGALSEAEQALQMSPNLAFAHAVLGAVLIFSGRTKDGISALQMSLRFDPYDPTRASRLNLLALGLYLSNEYESAVEVAKRAIRSNPDYPLTYRWLAAALGQLGRTSEAKEALEKAMAMAPASFAMYVRGVSWHRQEDHAHMLAGLRNAGWIADAGEHGSNGEMAQSP
jgi:adenylate cyclase